MLRASHNPRDSRGTGQPIRIEGTVLCAQRHICAFFNRHDDQYRVLLPFIKDGFECGEKAVHIIDPGRRNQHVQRLSVAGIDVGGILQQNPFFVPPEEFLRGLHERRERGQAAASA